MHTPQEIINDLLQNGWSPCPLSDVSVLCIPQNGSVSIRYMSLFNGEALTINISPINIVEMYTHDILDNTKDEDFDKIQTFAGWLHSKLKIEYFRVIAGLTELR